MLVSFPAAVNGFNFPTCRSDLNCDGVVDDTDLDILLACWGSTPKGACAGADINGDGNINASDLSILLSDWGPCS
jgi:hypothetical protein